MSVNREKLEEVADATAAASEEIMARARGLDMVVICYRPVAVQADGETIMWAVDSNVQSGTLFVAAQQIMLAIASGVETMYTTPDDPQKGGESDG